MDDAIAAMFAACLPGMVSEYGDLYADYVDLEQGLRKYLPSILAEWIAELLAPDGVGRRLYPAHICRYICAAMREAAARLDPPTMPPPTIATDDGAVPLDPRRVAYLVILLEESARDHAAAVLIGGPPPPPTTAKQRKAARKRRLATFVRVQRQKGLRANLCTVARAAGVRRKGRGSAARWIDGTLPDSAKAAQLIEGVLDFTPPLQSPTGRGSHLHHEYIECDDRSAEGRRTTAFGKD
jgi:hypothetical protein